MLKKVVDSCIDIKTLLAHNQVKLVSIGKKEKKKKERKI